VNVDHENIATETIGYGLEARPTAGTRFIDWCEARETYNGDYRLTIG